MPVDPSQPFVLHRFAQHGFFEALVATAAIIALRYGLAAGGALTVILLQRKALAPRRIQPQPFSRTQLLREALYSVSTCLVFAAILGSAFLLDKVFGVFRVYPDIATHGRLWFWLSIPVAVLMHDFYFYWVHRLMHTRALYDRAHRVHHLSTNPSPLAALAFHPLEAVVEILGILLIACIIPMHGLALATVMVISLLANVLGHLGYEMFPRGLLASPVGRLINTATNHNQHHRTFAYNFGLYTLIWDRMFGTLHPAYADLFRRVAGDAPAESMGLNASTSLSHTDARS